MKNLLKTIAVLGLVTASTGGARAAAVVGDLMLGFRLNGDAGTAPSASDNILLIDIGALSSFTGASGYFATGSYSLNLNPYLTAAFGANWNTNANLTFGIFGTSVANNVGPNGNPYTTWISAEATGAGLSSNYANIGTLSITSGTVRTAVTAANTVYSGFNSALSRYAGNSSVILAPNVYLTNQGVADADGEVNTWAGVLYNGAGANPNLFTGSALPYTQMGQNVTSLENYVDLRQLTNGSANTSVLGSFSLGSNGTLTTVAPVPEPSTYGILGAGALAGVALVRRRRKVA